jgi:hypothetical protein
MEPGKKVALLNLWVNVLREEETVETFDSRLTIVNADDPDAIVTLHAK